MKDSKTLLTELQPYFNKNGVYTNSTHPDWENSNHNELMAIIHGKHRGYSVKYQINHEVYDWTIVKLKTS